MRYAQAVALILALAPHGARGQVVDQCQAAKIKAAGTKTFDEARCRAKALASGAAIHPGCLTRAEDRFVRAMAKADLLGSCSGTASDVAAAVDQCVDTYAAVVSVPVTTTTVTSLATTTTAVSTTWRRAAARTRSIARRWSVVVASSSSTTAMFTCLAAGAGHSRAARPRDLSPTPSRCSVRCPGARARFPACLPEPGRRRSGRRSRPSRNDTAKS